MTAFITVLITAQEHVEEANDPKDLYPPLPELIVGAIAFSILFFFTWRWVLPRLGALLEERRQKIQGSLEEAEAARGEADKIRQRYEEQLRDARGEANRILDEARKTAERMRADIQTKAEEESRQVVAKAQEEIRAERDRAVQALRRELAEASVELASRVVGESLDRDRQLRLVDQYIDEVAGMSPNGDGEAG